LGVREGRGAFGELLRARRLAAGLTQEELAGQCGLSARALADMERSRTARPYRRSVALLADALGLSGEEGVLFARAARSAAVRELTAAREPDAAGAAVVPRQLPAAVRNFAGRSAELAELNGLLGPAVPGPRTVVISSIAGTAGVGKTSLAVHWAHQAAHLFPDGQLYVNLRGFDPSGAPVTSAAAVRGFLDALGVLPGHLPAGLDAQASLYRSLLAGRRTLIVLDNARDAAQVRPLLPGAPGCVVLVTSRHQLTGLAAADGARLLTVDVLIQAEARELLASRLGRGRVAAEPAAVTELIELCARLPLALGIAAARAARPGLPLAALATELRDSRDRLDVLSTGDAATDVRTVFSWSCQQLGEPAALMFRLLGLHPGPDITAPAAASLAGVPLARARQALAELARAHLIAEHVPGRYAFHDLLRTYAAEQAACHDSDATRDAIGRVLDHYLHTASAATLLMHPLRGPITLDPPQPLVRPESFTGRQPALEWFQAERLVLVAAISQAAGSGFDTHAWQLPWAAAAFFGGQGYWQELDTIEQSALAAARHLGDLTGQAQAHHHLGRVQAFRGFFAEAEAHLTVALELGQQLGSGLVQARVHHTLGWIVEKQGRIRDGLRHSEQAVCLFRAAGHRQGEAGALNAVGWGHALLGGYLEALQYCGQALVLYRELLDLPEEAATLDSLGYAHHHLGHHSKAIACYQQAIDVHGEAGDLFFRAECLTRLGDAQQAAGDHDAARRAWQRALAIFESMHHPDASQVRDRLEKPATAAAIR
jgi:tetratricopeptide (TPR) repeat protein/transcriptional regulator with XRE-family HTH domain